MNMYRSFIRILVGCLMTAIAFAIFILPAGFACGGITGFALILQKILPLKLSSLVTFVNTALFLIGWFCVGKDFVLKTAITCIVFPLALDYCGRFTILPGAFLPPVLSCLIGGFLLGAGTAIVISGNGSCCGFDIIGIVLHKYVRIPVALTVNLCSIAVILLQAANLFSMIYGALTILVCSCTMNYILTKKESSVPLAFAADK